MKKTIEFPNKKELSKIFVHPKTVENSLYAVKKIACIHPTR